MKGLLFIALLLLSLLLQSCSSNDGFHLRKNTELPLKHQNIQIDIVSNKNRFNKEFTNENNFINAFEVALEESGGKRLEKSSTKININNFREDKRVIAYTSKRKAREFLLSLKFDYTINLVAKPKQVKKHRITLDRVFIYDANFALGKAEEETQIRQSLYAEAARLILLKLQYSK